MNLCFIIGYIIFALIIFRRTMFYMFEDEIKTDKKITHTRDWGIGVLVAVAEAILWPIVLLVTIIKTIPIKIFISVPRKVQKEIVEERNKRTAKSLGLKDD